MRPTAHYSLSLQPFATAQTKAPGRICPPPSSQDLSLLASYPSSLPNSELFVSLLTTPMVLAKGEAEYMGTLGTAIHAHVRFGRKCGAVGSVRRRADPDGPGTDPGHAHACLCHHAHTEHGERSICTRLV
jgi:hypothetical protein